MGVMIGALGAGAISPTEIKIHALVVDWGGMMGYVVVRRLESGQLLHVHYGYVQEQEFIETGLSPGTAYRYEMYPQTAIVGGNPVFDFNDLVAAVNTETPPYAPPLKPIFAVALTDDHTALISARVDSYGEPNSGELYIMCRRDNGSFVEIERTDSNYLYFTFPNLVEGSTYRFVAVAENSGGLKSTSEYEDLVIEENGRMRVRSNNEWKKGVPYIRQGSVWRKGKMYVRSNGVWRKGK